MSDFISFDFNTLEPRIGKIIVRFGYADTLITDWITELWKHYPDDEQQPRDLKRRIKFLRRCFREIDKLRPMNGLMTIVLDQFKGAQDLRHYMVHGCVTKFNKKKVLYTFTKYDDGVQSSADISVSQMDQLAALGEQVVERLIFIHEQFKQVSLP